MKRLLTLFFLWLGTLNGWAQAPTPAQMGLTTASPNAVQIRDSSGAWTTIGTIDPATHLFTPAGVGSSTITANSTATSGFTAGNMIYSDGTKVQATQARIGSPNTNADVIYMGGGPVLSYTGNSYTYGYTPVLGLPANVPLAWWVSDPSSFDSALWHDASGLISQRNGTSPQGFHVYNTYTDASNGEWGYFDWTTFPGQLTIGMTANGTGNAYRPVVIRSALDSIVLGAAPGYTSLNSNSVGASYNFSAGNVINAANGFSVGATTGVSCTAGQVSVSTLGIVTGCGAAGAPSFPQTVAGTVTSGGIPYFSSVTQMSSSAVLTNNAVMIGKGAGAAPTTTTTPTASAFISNGTQPTIIGSGGTCATTTKVGGATVGTVVLSAVCASTNTIVWTGMPAVTNGYVCDAEDRTTQTAGPFIVSASTTTGFTLKVGATSSVAADVLQWKCIGY